MERPLETIRARSVLIAGGEEDPNDVQEAMARRIPNARSVHVAGVGHVGAFRSEWGVVWRVSATPPHAKALASGAWTGHPMGHASRMRWTRRRVMGSANVKASS